MLPRQKVAMVIICIIIFILILDLVRRRKLREEYSMPIRLTQVATMQYDLMYVRIPPDPFGVSTSIS